MCSQVCRLAATHVVAIYAGEFCNSCAKSSAAPPLCPEWLLVSPCAIPSLTTTHTALRCLHPHNRRLALQRVTVNVAPAFVWHHPSTGAEVVGLYHAYGYGGIGDSIAINAVVVPGLDEVCDEKHAGPLAETCARVPIDVNYAGCLAHSLPCTGDVNYAGPLA